MGCWALKTRGKSRAGTRPQALHGHFQRGGGEACCLPVGAIALGASLQNLLEQLTLLSSYYVPHPAPSKLFPIVRALPDPPFFQKRKHSGK